MYEMTNNMRDVYIHMSSSIFFHLGSHFEVCFKQNAWCKTLGIMQTLVVNVKQQSVKPILLSISKASNYLMFTFKTMQGRRTKDEENIRVSDLVFFGKK